MVLKGGWGGTGRVLSGLACSALGVETSTPPGLEGFWTTRHEGSSYDDLDVTRMHSKSVSVECGLFKRNLPSRLESSHWVGE